MKRLYDPAGMLASLPAGANIVLHSACAEPAYLAASLAAAAPALQGAHVMTLMPMGLSPYADLTPAATLDVTTFFPGTALRRALGAGRVRPLRHPLSGIPALFESGQHRVDALLLQVSPPDACGYVSLGLSVDYMRAALAQRPLVVAEVNTQMPRTCGDTLVPVSAIDWFVEATQAPQSVAPAKTDVIDAQIAANVASLVADGAVLQVGIGSLPDCVLGQLHHLKHLGVHSGVVTGAMQPLIEAGVIDNSRKPRYAGTCVTTMAIGQQPFYDFLHHNQAFEFHPCSLTHDRLLLSQIDGLYAINSALQVDLAGRVNAEVIGGRRISMPGGLPDFAAGAAQNPRSASIIALRSTFGPEGASNIVRTVAEVTVEAQDVDFVVTEYGIAALRGRSSAERARALAAVAHPSAREALDRTVCRGGIAAGVER